MLALVQTLNQFVSKYMAALVIIVTGGALLIPPVFTWVTPHITLLLGVVMFGMSMTLDLKDFQLILERPKDVLVGAVAQFTVMSGLAVSLAMLHFSPMAAIPGVLFSVWHCISGSLVASYLAKKTEEEEAPLVLAET